MIPLSLVKPTDIDGELYGVPVWEISELRVSLEQRHGALLPMVYAATGDLIEGEVLRLTPEEARDLGAALSLLYERARPSRQTE
ncbi:MAG TPA: hypothetical protein VHU85_08420 [Acidimicrobiales bacterium]|nr:hypothetical protein [Acidimicrobiales bacterium]